MSPFLAFNLGGPEMVVLFILILLLFGAKKLPGLARSIGQSLGEFRKAREEFEDEIRSAQVEEETRPRVKAPAERRVHVATEPKEEAHATATSAPVREEHKSEA